jgi:UDP-glucose:(heptosyl)LPS alpha-1,3-glucosyltransferase
MRIAIVVHDYHRQGGHSRYAVELAERFSVTDEVHVLANTFPAGATFAPVPALPGRRLYFHRIPANRRTAIGTILSFFLPATLALHRLGRFDVIHAQGLVCLQKSLVTAHICIAAWHQQRLLSGHGLSWKERVFDAVLTHAEQWLYRRQTGRPLIAISRRVEQDLASSYGCAQPVRVIPHGVDVREFDVSHRAEWRAEIRSRLQLPEDCFCALWVGDLRKGVKTAIEAVALNPGQRLLAVSRTNPDEFRRWSGTFGVSDRVVFVPHTDEIAKFYAAADVFLFPTAYDAFGMVVLEAMAMGTPVIVSRTAGAAELIEPGRDGLWLDDPFAAAEAAAALRSLEEDASARGKLGESGLARARLHHWDGVAVATYAVYREWAAF